MLEKAVIYNTIDRVGICPLEVFDSKTLPLGVSTEIELTKEQMRDLFDLYDRDKVDKTDFFGYALLHYMHTNMLEGIKSDVKIPLDSIVEEPIKETTIPKKYYLDAGVEQPIGDTKESLGVIKDNAHRPYGDTDFIR